MHDDSRDPLDETIDDVARSLTAGEPPAALRYQIRSRLERSDAGATGLAWRAAVALGAMVVVAVVTLTLTQLMPDRRDDTARTTRPGSDVELRAPAQTAGDVGGARDSQVAAAAPTGPPGVSRSTRQVMPTLFQVAPADEPAEVPFPLVLVEPVAVGPLIGGPVLMTSDAGPIPLELPRLDIAALTLE